MGKKLSFYFVRNNKFAYSCSEEENLKCYAPSIDLALEQAKFMFLNGADSVTIEFLGEHDLKF